MSKANIITLFPILEGRAKKNGLYPVCLVIYANGLKKRYRIGIDLTKDQWRKVSSKKLKDEYLKGIKAKISSFIEDGNDVLDKMDGFNFEKFEDAFFKKKEIVVDNISFTQCIQEYIEKNHSSWSIKSEMMYKSLIKSIEALKKGVKLKDVNHDFLLGYEAHLTSQGKTVTTIGIYLRQIRAICNYAINANYITFDKYPFKNYKIPAARKNKRALSNDELKILLNFAPKNKEEQKALDFWIFSYLGNGINFNDLAKLKYSNIQGEILSFIRTKTRNKNRSHLKEIRIFMLPKILDIIDRWGDLKTSETDYIFPILNEAMTAMEQYNAIAQFIKTTNKYLRRISAVLEFDTPITTYFARHSYATRLKRAGISNEYISEGLGHATTTQTEDYLSGFTDETIKKNANLLIDL